MSAGAEPSAAATKVSAPIDAFPGAEGAGRYAAGGRGGVILKVTNLADAGRGSLREAIETTGPRIIVFEVSGTIALESPLRIENSRVTVAGQTAPGGGITLRNYPLIVTADDVVIRFIRSRLGDERRSESDAIWVNKGRRIILDHVSASWSVDETLSVNNSFKDPQAGFYDVTVQWSIIAESLNRSVHVKGAHGYGSLIAGGNGTRISFHHNLWAHHLGRSPRPGNPMPPGKDPIGTFHDYRSNVFYDWGGAHAGYNADTGVKASIVKYNFIDNSYVRGSASTGTIAFQESNELAQAWFSGNSMDGVIPKDPWSLVSGKQGAAYQLKQPVDVAPISPDSAESSYARVLNAAGASLARDAVDTRMVRSVRDRTGALINSQKEVGGWPELTSTLAPPDTDGDGIPDEWERAHGLDPQRADDRFDPDGNGYTNIEEYLNALVPRVEVLPAGGVYRSIGEALTALPALGGEIALAPGEYREKVHIDKPNVRLRGFGARPEDVVIVWSDGAVNAGGTLNTATLSVSGDGFRADHLTVQNDYSQRFAPPSQAVALAVTGDRAIFNGVRLIGAQDTLYAGTRKCGEPPCRTSRQYFRDCTIEGHVDFIFGDSKAFFDHCRIHAIARDGVFITAHSRTAADQDRAFVFDGCVLTADPKARNIFFGRPWRDYAAVIFMNTRIDADLHPDGWREWTPNVTQRLKTAFYAEYGSTGRGANPGARQSHAHQLTKDEAAKWSARAVLSGDDGWRPDLLND